MQERRLHRRYPVSLNARAIIADTHKAYEGKVTDISFSGVRFVCGERIEKDQKLELILVIDNQEVTLEAVVVWVERLEYLEGIQHGMKVAGVKFVGDRKQLEDFFKNIQGRS